MGSKFMPSCPECCLVVTPGRVGWKEPAFQVKDQALRLVHDHTELAEINPHALGHAGQPGRRIHTGDERNPRPVQLDVNEIGTLRGRRHGQHRAL